MLPKGGFEGYGALSYEDYRNLKQGQKVRFKWYGSDVEQVGYIETTNKDGEGCKYFNPEHMYNDDGKLKSHNEHCRIDIYRDLSKYYYFNYFHIVD